MMRLIPLEDLFCLMGSSHSIVADSCRNPNGIFNFFNSLYWRTFRRQLGNCMQCKEPCYSIYYWALLIFSLYGLVHSHCMFFYNIYRRGEEKASTTWYNNQFHVLPPYALQRLRYFTGFISGNSWLLLAYAVIFVSPNHMLPWLIIQTTIFSCHLFLSLLEAIMGRLWHRLLYTLVSKIVHFLSIVLVYQSLFTFRNALKNNSPDKLMLWLQDF